MAITVIWYSAQPYWCPLGSILSHFIQFSSPHDPWHACQNFGFRNGHDIDLFLVREEFLFCFVFVSSSTWPKWWPPWHLGSMKSPVTCDCWIEWNGIVSSKLRVLPKFSTIWSGTGDKWLISTMSTRLGTGDYSSYNLSRYNRNDWLAVYKPIVVTTIIKAI